MSTLADYTNAVSPETFGDLTETTAGRGLTAGTPVLATPAVVVTMVAAFAAGYAMGRSGTVPK
ncbi:hypothetical protein [Microtetraspora fusca]|uniref:hypothetical protein n=1 Tax=Microtetraspora fusca TaxID=1997 RepID=UPI00082B49F8|nr:hypothetical protein [Microtetraspora fusca]